LRRGFVPVSESGERSGRDPRSVRGRKGPGSKRARRADRLRTNLPRWPQGLSGTPPAKCRGCGRLVTFSSPALTTRSASRSPVNRAAHRPSFQAGRNCRPTPRALTAAPRLSDPFQSTGAASQTPPLWSRRLWVACRWTEAVFGSRLKLPEWVNIGSRKHPASCDSQPNFFHGIITTRGPTAVIPGAMNTPRFRAVTC